MRPISLTIQAFGSYAEKTTIDFSKPAQNIFLVTGATGSGKTTIFDAMVFALYGEASSEENKKEGMVLQSQFAPLSVKPYVEFVFSEKNMVYTVNRSPQHFEERKRGEGAPVKRSEEVTLTLPDESIWPSKETNAKIIELVGLTKSQFMQVGMIAQGEFMNILRAKTKEKKEIFRKLFGTEKFDKVVEELKSKVKSQESEIKDFQKACVAQIGLAQIPNTDSEHENIIELQKKIVKATEFSITDVEIFEEELKNLCEKLEEKYREVGKEYEEADENQKKAAAKVTEAKSLESSFNQLANAEKTLKECENEKEDVQKSETLAKTIKSAYEVDVLKKAYDDKKKSYDSTVENIKNKKAELPDLNAALSAAKEAEEKAKDLQNNQNTAYGEIKTKCEKAIELFKDITNAQKALKDAESLCESAKKAEQDAKAEKEKFEIKKQEWNKKVKELSYVNTELSVCEIKLDSAKNIEKEINNLVDLNSKVNGTKIKWDKTVKDYENAREVYSEKKETYEQVYQAFMDAQAGLIAKTLVEGEKCPVCGSIHHPEPKVLSSEYEHITQEYVESLRNEYDEAQNKLNTLSQESGVLKTDYTNKADTFIKDFANLREKMSEIGIENVPEVFSESELMGAYSSWRIATGGKVDSLKELNKELNDIQKNLDSSETKTAELTEAYEKAREALTKTETDKSGKQSALDELLKQKTFETENDARVALKEAETSKQQADDNYKKANMALSVAQENVNNANTLINNWEKELPDLLDETERRHKEYSSALTENNLTEKNLLEITARYEKSDAEDLELQVTAFNKKYGEAETTKKNALEVIKDREKPDIEALTENAEKANIVFNQKNEERNTISSIKRINGDVSAELTSLIVKRSKKAEEYNRIYSLHRYMSGNVKGSRMDLETYVQRYYLKRILVAANRRFSEMTANQYRIKMCELEDAGDGGNKGLDLMVYSRVTNQEREITTLSGGESFMAALSMALGMADQIQASSAAVRLDVMFIDEGFGSLDDHSRNQAVRVLKEMAGSNRLIGIISHVNELKQEIEDQLNVTKDDTGSHINWV